MPDSIRSTTNRPDGSAWRDCSQLTFEEAEVRFSGQPFAKPCSDCGDLLVLHGARGCIGCQIRHDMGELGAGLNQALQLAALDPDRQPTAQRQGPKVCPPGPNRLECTLTPEGHLALVRERERYGESDPSWGWLHSYDVEPLDEWRGGVQVRTAGHPQPSASFWGDGYNDTAEGRAYFCPGA